jgi:hypothetical protein
VDHAQVLNGCSITHTASLPFCAAMINFTLQMQFPLLSRLNSHAAVSAGLQLSHCCWWQGNRVLLEQQR